MGLPKAQYLWDMQLPNRQRIAVFMMAFSLLLLLAFLCLFLKKTYEDELETLKRETSLLFVNSVRGIEGEMIDKMILRTKDIHGADSTLNISLHLPESMPHDSIRMFTFVQKRMEIDTESHFRIRIPDGKPLTGNPDMAGSLSVILAMSDDKKQVDSLYLPGLDSTKIMALLEKNFQQSMLSSGLPVSYKILRSQKDSVVQWKGFIAGSYTDLASGVRYGAQLANYNGYIIRQMLPQTLFALFLFLCVALAFGFIFQTMRRQQLLAEQKNDFIRNVTHELKTPIATVSVAIEALQNFDALRDPERTREYLDISRLELSRLSLLVDKVLRMSLFEKGAPELKLEPLDLKSLIEEILGSMKLQFEKYGARVGFNTSGADFTFNGDRLHLASVVYNLLDNALKYSPKQPDIAIGLIHTEGQLTLQVRDKGIGIPAAYRDKIFEKFFRVPSGDIHNVKGHGLGLSYVAGVVSQHGGSIDVDSKAGEGACFKIILPT